MATNWDNSVCLSGEARFSGVAGFCDLPTAIGKMYIWENERAYGIPDTAIICIFDSQSASCASAYMAIVPPSAVILSSAAISAKLLSFLICSKIPYLILNDTPKHPRAYAERVALLDIKNGLLIINPQIETLNSYSLSENAIQTFNEELPYSPPFVITEKSKKSILIDGNIIKLSEMLEALINLAEAPYQPHIRVMLDVPKDRDECEYFSERIETLFRAAVYGSFSLLLKGYTESSQIYAALGCMNEVFCRLDYEGHEFNGYIKKGLLIDAPIWIMQQSVLANADFTCFDLDCLLCRLFGIETSDSISSEQELCFLRIWEHYIKLFHPDCPILLKSEKQSLIQGLSQISCISEIYIK